MVVMVGGGRLQNILATLVSMMAWGNFARTEYFTAASGPLPRAKNEEPFPRAKSEEPFPRAKSEQSRSRAPKAESHAKSARDMPKWLKSSITPTQKTVNELAVEERRAHTGSASPGACTKSEVFSLEVLSSIVTSR